MIAILINGTLGTGKTTTAQALNRMFEKSVHIEGDGFLWSNPPPKDSYERSKLLKHLLPEIIRFWKNQSIDAVIFSYLMPETFFIKDVEDLFKGNDIPVHTFTLWGDKELVHSRILSRNRKGRPEFEIKPSDRCAKILEEQEYIGTKIELSENDNPEAVANKILGYL